MSVEARSPLIPSDADAPGAYDAEGLSGVVARSPMEQAWRRFRRDRVALASGVVIILMLLIAFIGAPLAESWAGHGPNDLITHAVVDYQPVGPLTTVKDNSGHNTLLVLGASDLVGRDEFLRLLYGAQVSLEVGLLATFFGLSTGVILGTLAGYYGGVIDTVVSRLTEIIMAFPFLLFLIALAATLGQRLNDITMFGLFSPGVFTLVLVLSIFSWFYPARIIRSQVLSLREKEFVEAARMVGASNFRIMRSHLLPHLVGTIIVYGTITVAINILAEATLSYVGVGLPDPNASWGKLLDTAVQYYTTQPWLIVWPGMALLIVTLSFNLLGDGLRDAFDPRANL
ncbi:MAG: peptide/nickel transport system permease protein [Gaiellales bacterium]|jgi:peptide/nickel transport system permease protein|nr:peptide/nickel transport system permease protein [Gaiellales bacterium]MDX6545251.1 peptide/nickel transport system permease protein [Gaiellales bacterium]